MNRLARAINSVTAWCPKSSRPNVPGTRSGLMVLRATASVITPLGLLLWFLSMGPLLGAVQVMVPVLGPILACKFLRYAISAVGMVLIASGVALLTASFGRAYLRFFLAFGVLAGAPTSFVAFNGFWTGFAQMMAVGEASVLTFLYWALAIGFLYGLAGGVLGVVVCLIMRRLSRNSKPVNAPANGLSEVR